jgi:hypothetical protein
MPYVDIGNQSVVRWAQLIRHIHTRPFKGTRLDGLINFGGLTSPIIIKYDVQAHLNKAITTHVSSSSREKKNPDKKKRWKMRLTH